MKVYKDKDIMMPMQESKLLYNNFWMKLKKFNTGYDLQKGISGEEVTNDYFNHQQAREEDYFEIDSQYMSL